MLLDFGNGGDKIDAYRPSVVRASDFISNRAAAGQVRILGQVNDEATDAEFEEYLNESNRDVELAVNSFLATYGEDTKSLKQVRKEQTADVPLSDGDTPIPVPAKRKS